MITLPLCRECVAAVRATRERDLALRFCASCEPKVAQCFRVMLTGEACVVRYQGTSRTSRGDAAKGRTP